MSNKILITGCAGFIGFHLSKLLSEESYDIIGIDNINDYYDINLKKNRLNLLKKNNNFQFIHTDITDVKNLNLVFKDQKIRCIIHLAAQAGVRYSFINPQAYIDSNITGYINILEACKNNNINFFIYASSSSVYGESNNFPFKETDNSIKPISLYGVSKKFNEELAYSYHKLFGINSLGLRFFTVYGPWGRPDMALFNFTKSILKGEKINVFNNGIHQRSFSYIDDIIHSVKLLHNNFSNKNSFYEIFNIGGDESVRLMDFIGIIEKHLNIISEKNFLPKQTGDIESTSADCSKLYDFISFTPKTPVNDGIKSFIDWYKGYVK